MTCRVSSSSRGAETWNVEKKPGLPRLLTQTALLFLLPGFASVLFLFTLLHSSLIAFFIFMCLDTNWQMLTEPGSCCLSWCLQAGGPGRANAKKVVLNRPPKCHGYETKLAEVKSNLYQTSSQKQLHFIKK